MNTARNDHQQTLQTAAVAFIQRHQAEHLGDDQRLFSRAVAHLVASLNATQAEAENAVGRAQCKPAELPQASDIEQAARRFMANMAPGQSAQVRCFTTSQYLAGRFDLTQAQAEDAAAQAYAHQIHYGNLYLDASRSTGELAMLRDAGSNMVYAVPVASIVAHIIQHSRQRRLLHLVH